MLLEKDTMRRPITNNHTNPAAPEQRAVLVRRGTWRLQALVLASLYWWPVKALARVLGPARAAGWLGGLARICGPYLPRHRIVLRNLQLAFPKQSADERQRLARLVWESIGHTAGELPQLPALAAKTDERIVLRGAEHLETAATAARGTVFISAHFANWEVMMLVVCRRIPDCLAVYRAANNPHIDRQLARLRRAYGVAHLAPKGSTMRPLLRALAAGRAVALLSDQKFNEGLALDFFGQAAMTAPGPAQLALKYAATIVPVSTRRLSPMRFEVEFHPPFVPQNTGDAAADTRRCMQRINAFIEAQIRAHPAQWLWLHRRWPARLYRDSEDGA